MRESVGVATPVSLWGRVASVLKARVPTRLWGLGRGLVEMSLLASLVPVASDLVVTSVFVGYSAYSAWRLLRGGSTRVGSDEESSDGNAEQLLRLHDRFDATTGFLDDIGRVMPLSIPVLWFSLSIPAYLGAGLLPGAGLLALAAGVTFVPLFLSARAGLFKAIERLRTRKRLAVTEDGADALGR